jgi:Glyoxalase-like domain
MSMHLDIEVDDLDVAGAPAVEAGATLAEFQPQDDVRVYLDPAGHPFCLFRPECAGSLLRFCPLYSASMEVFWRVYGSIIQIA